MYITSIPSNFLSLSFITPGIVEQGGLGGRGGGSRGTSLTLVMKDLEGKKTGVTISMFKLFS